jgi:anti-sigma factor RsiW
VTRIGTCAQHRWAHARLSAYLDGELSPRQRRRLERHVSACADCAPTLRSLIRVIHALRTLPRPPASAAADGVVARLRTDGAERDRSTRT